jgi:ribose-phosphate pyrophosphokinase
MVNGVSNNGRMMKNLRIFGLEATHKFAEDVADHLDVNLNRHIEKYFPDREPYLRADENVRGCDVYVVQSLYTDKNESINDKFTKLLYFIGSLKDASAERVTAVIPYFGYQRQDRKTESRAPITTKYVAMMLEAVGANRVLSMDVHSLAVFQNSIRIPTDHLEAKNLIVEHISKTVPPNEEIAVLAPDSGGAGRADRFRKALAVKMNKKILLVHMDKIREGSVVHGTTISDDIKGRIVIAVDDMISSGSTLGKCTETVDKFGGVFWGACASHGLFVGDVNTNLTKIKNIITTDTIAVNDRLSSEIMDKLTVLSATKLFAKAIRRIHDEGGSISDLLR